MPGYTEHNALGADFPLPRFYWDANTEMRCVADAVTTLRRHGTNHHIQRLMVTGNFALIAGLDPQAVNEWYWLAYTDAYEWVVSPNVLGMAFFADGGRLATKPYAASANYLTKMGDACGKCAYKPRKTVGDDACPFNALYWDFVARTTRRLRNNHRLRLAQRAWQKRPAGDKKQIRARAKTLRARLRRGERV
jgi:deoxyribodipyrimidine photolyase-related protein